MTDTGVGSDSLYIYTIPKADVAVDFSTSCPRTMTTRNPPKRFFSGVSVRASMAHEALVEQRQHQWRPFSRDPFYAPADPIPVPKPVTRASRPSIAERPKSTYSTDKRGFIDTYELVS
jgi:hypothetical protein